MSTKFPFNVEKLPDPVGYKILVVIPKFEDADPTAKSAAALGLELPEMATRREEAASVVMQVVKVGPDAYKDLSRFTSGPWCRVGDYVLTRAYSGTRFFSGGLEFRFLNDDAVEGVTQDYSGITRI